MLSYPTDFLILFRAEADGSSYHLCGCALSACFTLYQRLPFSMTTALLVRNIKYIVSDIYSANHDIGGMHRWNPLHPGFHHALEFRRILNTTRQHNTALILTILTDHSSWHGLKKSANIYIAHSNMLRINVAHTCTKRLRQMFMYKQTYSIILICLCSFYIVGVFFMWLQHF